MASINLQINFNGNAEGAFNFDKSVSNKLFNGLSADGQIEFLMFNSPWGSYFGMFRDKKLQEFILK